MEPLIFPIYKPVGKSSFDVIRQIKRVVKSVPLSKIGHFGTLDPFAEGLLLIGINGAQKMNDYVHLFMPKTYHAQGIFGVYSTTGDMTGELTCSSDQDIPSISQEDIERNLQKFIGSYLQTPHQISAVKVDGVRLYKHNRGNTSNPIIPKAVMRTVHEIKIQNFIALKRQLDFSATVSSGTYIRTLFVDLANQLHTTGALKTLTRFSIGHLNINHAIPFDQIEKLNEENYLRENSLSLSEMVLLPSIHFQEEESIAYVKGQKVALDRPFEKRELKEGLPLMPNYFWMYSREKLIGLGMMEGDYWKVIFNLPMAVVEILA